MNILEDVKVQWSHEITGNQNDGNINVYGTEDKDFALGVAQDFWKKELPHLTCYRWGAQTYSDDPNKVIVTCGDVG